MVDLYETLQYFMQAPSVTGFEQQRRERIIEVFSKYCDSVSVDVMGNVIGTLGDGERDVMLAGHYDQLGFMITYVQDNGFAGFTQVGGWDNRVAYGTRVKVWIGDGPEDYIIGAVAVKAAHLTDTKERDKSPDLKDMLIDLGVDSKEEAEKLGVKPGTVCTPYLDVTRPAQVIQTNSLDQRSTIYAASHDSSRQWRYSRRTHQRTSRSTS